MNRDNYLKKKYGITEKDYNILLKKNNGGCWICGRKPKKRRLCVDHNHKTGQVRGLLCYKCNYGLPWFNDDPELLMKANKYLTHESQENNSTYNGNKS